MFRLLCRDDLAHEQQRGNPKQPLHAVEVPVEVGSSAEREDCSEAADHEYHAQTDRSKCRRPTPRTTGKHNQANGKGEAITPRLQ